MKKGTILPTLVVLVCSCVAQPNVRGAANLLANGDFESEPNWGSGVSGDGSYTALAGSQIPGWMIEPDHAVTVHISPGSYLVISNAYSANLDGEGYHGHNANFYQDFDSSSDVTYALSFDWQSWGFQAAPTTSSGKISVTDMVTTNTLFVGLYNYDGDVPHPVHHVTTYFSGTGNTLRLRIEESPESGDNDNSYVVDNFSVVETGLPRLGIILSAPLQTTLYWPTNTPGFTLEAATTLPASTWNTVTTVPTVVGPHFNVTVPATNAQQFFQLHSQ